MGIRSKVEEGFHVSALPCGVVSDTKLFVMLSNAMDRIRSVPMGPSIEHPPAKPLRAAQTSNCRHPCGTAGAAWMPAIARLRCAQRLRRGMLNRRSHRDRADAVHRVAQHDKQFGVAYHTTWQGADMKTLFDFAPYPHRLIEQHHARRPA